MFVLAEMQDTVRVAPGAFGKPTTDIVKAEVDAKSVSYTHLTLPTKA